MPPRRSETSAATAAKRLEHGERAGLVLMQKPPIGGTTAIGRGHHGRRGLVGGAPSGGSMERPRAVNANAGAKEPAQGAAFFPTLFHLRRFRTDRSIA